VNPGDDVRSRTHAGGLFWTSAAAGWALIGYGVRGLLQHHIDTRPSNLATFAVAGALFHDLIFAPTVLVLGVVVARVVPRRTRAVVQGALIVSGCLALFSYPLVRDYARVLHNPSSLPHNYTANLVLALGTVWAAATVVVLVHLRAKPTAS
jgi:hypothetical protein